MIKYNLHKPIEITNNGFSGVIGDNLSVDKHFFINGLLDPTMNFSIHLRFSDKSVNSIIPDDVIVHEDGTELIWKIKKNDIFVHGYFELQIEGRNPDGVVFQTEIVNLYADESIPIEDNTYENPNSETLKLRDEISGLRLEIESQNKQLSENIKVIENSDLSKKQDILTFDFTPTIGSSNPVTSDGIANELLNKADCENVYLVEEADDHFISKHEAQSVFATKTALDKKYDASNMENGSGTLSPVPDTPANTGTFTYSKAGNIVTVTISATVKSATGTTNTARFAGLPYAVKSGNTQNNLIVSQFANHYRSCAINSALYLTPVSSNGLTPITPTNGDIIKVCLVYEI